MSDETKRDDGGPAFPGIEGQDGHGNCTRHVQHDLSVSYVTHNQGMSLRDWFAGMAIPGICKEFYDHEDVLFTSHDIAREAYEIADAMLIARSPNE